MKAAVFNRNLSAGGDKVPLITGIGNMGGVDYAV